MNIWQRILLHALVVGLALAGGLAAGHAFYRERTTNHVGVHSQTPFITSPTTQTAGRTAEVEFTPLTARSDKEINELAEQWRTNFNSALPFRAQAAALLDLLRGTKTNEDFARVVDVLNGLPGHHEAKDHVLFPVVDLVFRRWAALDPRAAALGAAALTNRGRQQDALRIAIGAWTQREGAAVLEKLRDLPKGLASSYGPAVVFDQLALDNPEQALELAQQTKEGRIGSGKFTAIFRQWAERDPQAVAQWISTQTAASASPNRSELLDALGTFGERHPAQAWELAAKLPAGSWDRNHARDRILSSWLSHDPDGAMASVLALTELKERTQLLRQLGMNSMLRQPSLREELLAKLPDDSARQHFLTGVATGIVRQGADGNFAEAGRIALALPANEERSELLRELGTYWGRHDPAATSQWLTDQPAGPERDTVIGEFVRSVFPNDPAAGGELGRGDR